MPLNISILYINFIYKFDINISISLHHQCRDRLQQTSHGSVSVFNVGIGIRYFCRYFFKSVRYSVSVFQNIAISVRYFGISASLL